MQGAIGGEESWRTLFQEYGELDRLGEVGREAQALVSFFSELPCLSGGERSETTLLIRKFENPRNSKLSLRQRQTVVEALKALQIEEKTLGLLKREEIIYKTILSSGIIERLGEMHLQLLEEELKSLRESKVKKLQQKKAAVSQLTAERFGVSSSQITVEEGEELQDDSSDIEIIVEM